MRRRRGKFAVSFIIILLMFNLVIIPEASLGEEPLAVPPGSANLDDLKNHWAEQEIRLLVDNQIVQGSNEHGKIVILPERPISRAEFITVLVRLLGLSPSLESSSSFSDIDSHWARGFIQTAQQKGLARGYQDGKFGPELLINRAEAVTLLSRAKGWKAAADSLPTKPPYSDVNVLHWAYPFIHAAREYGIVTGYPDGTFRPEQMASRAEAFVLISKGFLGEFNGSGNKTALGDKSETIPTLDKKILEVFKVTTADADDDGDELPNQLEILSGLDPTSEDSNRNGILDSREDPDEDGLNNYHEQTLGTDPQREDTDGDNINDGTEVNTYKTNPLEQDTDQDGMSDGTEVRYGLSALKVDTDADGTPDGQKWLQQKVSWQIEQNYQVAVDLETQGDLARNATISNASGDPELTNVPGLIGKPVDIEVKAQFNSATMEFSFDPVALNGSRGKNIQILWVDKDNQSMVPLDKQWIEPKENKVYGTTTHFSKYLVVDKEKWQKAWDVPLQKVQDSEQGSNKRVESVSVAIVIDSSLTMSRNDPNGERKIAVKNFVRGLLPGDRAALIDFDQSARVLQALTTNMGDVEKAVDQVDEAGGTIIDGAIKKGVEQLAGAPVHNNKYLILVTDGKDEAGVFDEEILREAIKQQVTVFTVGLGAETDRELLQRIALETGGKYYSIQAAAEIHGAFERIAGRTGKAVDTDQDGLPDQVETGGMRIYTGELVKTDPKSKDTDRDGIPDGFELGEAVADRLGRKYYRLRSNPALPDSDGDGILDAEDPQPLNRKFPLKTLPVLFVHGAMAAVSPDFKQVGKYNQVLTNITPLKGGYDGFFDALEEAGYRDYLYFASYDWRHDTRHSVQNYLVPAINRMETSVKAKIKAQVATEFAKYKQANPYFRELSSRSVIKYNLVAHSMGGIVSRLFIEGDYQPYNARVNKLIMVGTPNQGSVNAYTIWQGGVGQDLTYKLLLRFFLGEFYKHFYGGKPSLNYDSTKMLGIIRNYFPSVKVLLPTWKFLIRPGSLFKEPIYEGLSPEDSNNTLIWLNSPENLNKLYRRTNVLTIAGTGQEVYKGIWLTPKAGPTKKSLPWQDGKPLQDVYGNFRFQPDPVKGDGTVRVEAVKLLAKPELFKGEHSLLLSEKAVVNKVLSELGINYNWGGELSLLDNEAAMLNHIAEM